MENIDVIKRMPLVPLRGLVLFPGMTLHFDVGRKSSIAAVKAASEGRGELFLTMQKDAMLEDPQQEDLYSVGVVAEVKQMIRVTEHEVRFETGKHLLNLERQDEALCRTKYPILLVHGFFFRDSRIFNYWGRIPRELERNGANIYYGQQQSADSIENSAEELKTRIRAIVKDTGCEKLNVIAHSKGGLDMRQALLDPEIRAMTASLTTINTPHRGCAYADYLLEKIPEPNQRGIEKAYNAAARRLGDRDPDFMAAVRDLTKARCEEFDRQTPLPVGVFCQSVGSRLSRAGAARFPQNATYHLALHFDGPNDGLVSEGSFRWGSRLLYLTTPGREGISHGDVVDLNRRDIPEFDVREFYVRLVHDLKARGL